MSAPELRLDKELVMWLSLLVWSAFNADPTVTSEGVFGQMRASAAEIKTLSFDFRCTESFTPRLGVKGEPKTRNRNFVGKVWFAESSRLRVEFSEGDGLEFNTGQHTESKIAISNNAASRIFVSDQKAGIGKGAITEGVTAWIAVPGLSLFCPREILEFDSKYLQFPKITASWNGDLVRLSGRGRHEREQIQWDIDAARGFSFVTKRRESDLQLGKTLAVESFQLLEAVPGIWIPRHIDVEARINGEISQQVIADLVPETVKLNEAIPDKMFDLTFPIGTEVLNTNQKTTYIEGGGTSRSRENVAKLAREAKGFDSAHSVPVPVAAVPLAGSLTSESSSRSTIMWIAAASLVIVAGGVFGVRRWRSRP